MHAMQILISCFLNKSDETAYINHQSFSYIFKRLLGYTLLPPAKCDNDVQRYNKYFSLCVPERCYAHVHIAVTLPVLLYPLANTCYSTRSRVPHVKLTTSSSDLHGVELPTCSASMNIIENNSSPPYPENCPTRFLLIRCHYSNLRPCTKHQHFI